MMPLRIKLTRPSLTYASTVSDYFKPTSRLYGRRLPLDCYLGTRSVTVTRAIDLTNTGADLVKIVFKLERTANLAGLSCFFGCEETKERYCAEARCYYYLVQENSFLQVLRSESLIPTEAYRGSAEATTAILSRVSLQLLASLRTYLE